MQPTQTQEKIQVDLYRGQMLPWHEHVLSKWDESRYKAIAAGRKARKTTFTVNELMIHAMTCTRGLTYPIIGPTRIQEKEIVWDDHVATNLRILKQAGVPFVVNKSDLSVSFPGYGKFTVDGGDNIESLRGKSDWGGVGLDEVAFWKDFQYAWGEVIEPNLIVHDAFVIFGSTTNGYDEFHKIVKYGDHGNVIEGTAYNEEGDIITPNSFYQSFRFTSFDNPNLSREWLKSKQDTMSAEAFNREYLARFEKFTGLIYKDFSRTIHVKEDMEVSMYWQHYRAMDFGSVNPTVCLFIGVDGQGTVYVYDEYYNTGEATPFHANVINAKTNPEYTITTTWGDPSGNQAILDYAMAGVIITPALKIVDDNEVNWTQSGIKKVQGYIKPNPQTGKPKLYISPKCVNLLREFETYHWLQAKSGVKINDVPEKVDDHCMDALRYFICSYTHELPSYEGRTYQPPVNQFTGYGQQTQQ